MILRQYTNAEQDKVLRLNESFFRKANDADFKTIIDWLKSEIVRLSKENMTKQDIQFKWNQGGLQSLCDIVDMSDRSEAEKIIEKLRK